MVKILFEDPETEECYSIELSSTSMQVASLLRRFHEQNKEAEALSLLRQRYPNQFDFHFHYEFDDMQLSTKQTDTLESLGIFDGSVIHIVPTAIEIVFYDYETEAQYPLGVSSIAIQVQSLLCAFHKEYKQFVRGTVCFSFVNVYIAKGWTEKLFEIGLADQSMIIVVKGRNPNIGVGMNAWSHGLAILPLVLAPVVLMTRYCTT